MPDAFAALLRLRETCLQDPLWVGTHQAPHLQICAACRDALLHDLDRQFLPMPAPHRMTLDNAQVLGFTFEDGPPDTCALHPFLHGEDAS
jgi:hypothetical protein